MFSENWGLINSPYNKTTDKVLRGVAVMTGPSFAENEDYDSKPSKILGYYRALLAAGYHVCPTVDHDNHNLTSGTMASSRTMVMAKSLAQKDITDAYLQMRFYASMDWNTKVDFTQHQKGICVKSKSH